MGMQADYRTSPEVKKIIRLTMALPFLPQDKLVEGLGYIRGEAGVFYVENS